MGFLSRDCNNPEEEIGKVLVPWLEQGKWDVYCEVQYGSKIADIVAKKDGYVWVIEIKVASSSKSVRQALHWKGKANYISVCTLDKKNVIDFKNGCLSEGIGVILVTRAKKVGRFWIGDEFQITEESIGDKCKPQHKEYAAGNAKGERFSDFMDTKQQLLEYVKKHPGCSVQEAVDNISHHYRTRGQASTALLFWIKDGEIPIRLDKRKKPFKLYPMEGNNG